MKYVQITTIAIIKYYLLIFTFICISANTAFTQDRNDVGTPFIKNFSATEINAHSQNFDAAQDYRGIMYFGNFAGVLEYDGVEWRTIYTKQGTLVQSITRAFDNRIYVGGRNEIGYLQPDNTGQMAFQPLPNVADSIAFGKNVKEIFSGKDAVYILTDSLIYKWKNQQLTTIAQPNNEIAFAALINEKIYYQVFNGSFFCIENDVEKNINFGKNVPESISIINIFETETNNFLVISNQSGIFTIKNDSITTTNFKTDSYITDITCAIKISNNIIAAGTRTKGILVFSTNGQLINSVNVNNGLISNEINSLFIDNKNTIWAATTRGISHLEMPSPLTAYLSETNIKAEIFDLKRKDNTLYIATSQGLYYIDSLNNINQIKYNFTPIDFACYNLENTDLGLLAASSRGVYVIKSKDDVTLLPTGFSTCLYYDKENNKVYVGKSEGLTALIIENKNWAIENKIYDINTYIAIIQKYNNDLWIETLRSGIIKYNLNSAKSETFNIENTIGRYVSIVDNNVLITTELGVFQYYYQGDSLGKVDYFGGTKDWIYKIWQETDGTIWTNDGDGENITCFANQNGKYQITNQELKLIHSFIVNKVFFDNNIVWLAGPDGFIRFDKNLETNINSSFFTHIRKVTTTKDSLLFGGAFFNDKLMTDTVQNEFLIPSLSYSDNTVTFYFSSSYFPVQGEVEYTYFLEGFDKSWSAPTKITSKEYTNLPEGKYTFYVKATNIYGVESTVAKYEFRIKTPLYRQWWAIIIYIVAFAALVYLFVRHRSKALIKEKIELENLILERTEEILFQKEEIEKQSKELSTKNDELEKINIIVKSINSEIYSQNLYESLLHRLRMIKGTETALIIGFDKETERYRIKASDNTDYLLMKSILFTTEEIENVFLSNAKEVYEDIFLKTNLIYPAKYEALQHVKKPKSALILQIETDNHIDGYIILQNTIREDAFDKRDFSLTKNLKEHIIAAFIKTNLLENLQFTLQNLRDTQEELVRQEKLASVGQLTQGIVDRIINPLNYILNFSQLSVELLTEVQEIVEDAKEDLDKNLQADFDDIFGMMDGNLKKILEHGGSATRIVKELEMVLRAKPTTLVPMPINNQLEHFVNFTHNNMKEKNQINCNIKFNYHFDSNIGQIMVITGEFGKVIENMINNAIDAVLLKRSKNQSFQPEITIKTAIENDLLLIKIHDNGIGVPPQNLEKLFDPLFTTKPTALGTGLGLYMALDTIKLHKGTIEVQSIENQYTEFTIKIPAIKPPQE